MVPKKSVFFLLALGTDLKRLKNKKKTEKYGPNSGE